MYYRNIKFTLKNVIALIIYKLFLVWLPESSTPIFGKPSKKLRYLCCKNIFLFCGKNVNVERWANFGTGFRLKIGNNSGLGINCRVTDNLEIGENVMMGLNCNILPNNHIFDRVDIPIIQQGESEEVITIIEDDVWIGNQVVLTPGRTIKKGSIIAAGCVLSKDFPEYSIVGGNPSRLIRSRI